MAEFLQLGPVQFAGFELPGRIGFGGAQRLAVHQLPGGARVVDAMGPDNAEIGWSGAFAGPDAADRARLLDGLRAGGGVWPLSWDGFAYLVTLARFEAQYQRSNWVPYRLSCLVVQDLTQNFAPMALDVALDVASGVLADAAAAGAPAQAALAALAVSGASAPGSAAYAAALAGLGAAQSEIVGGLAGAGQTLLAAADPASAASAAGTLAQLASAQGYVGRALANLTDLGG